MFLKEIEMQGFKSFADKTKVEFDQGVTAVVGPNGSGKSNITESLRWALGESSAKSLRGGKMPDVIFAGTENRKPLNFAQVTVVLDNRDGFIKDAQEEIRVERHIYRNGDSDYLIDGKKVRLRDIHDLFMDTGLGRDSFSIISQGRVEAIFNSKPEERRAIFEEAAGVLKYKTRKKETQTKLNQTQDNLDRLEDIIYELETQIKPLERQAKVAKEFLLLEADRKKGHLDLLVHRIIKNKAFLETQENQLEAAKGALKGYYKEREKLEETNQTLKAKRQTLTQKVEQKQAQLLDLTRLISDLERQIDLISLESSQKAEKKELSQANLKQLEAQRSILENELTAKEDEINELLLGIDAKKTQIAKVETDLSRFSTNPDAIIEGLREDFVRLMQKEADLSNQVTALDSDLEKQRQASNLKTAEMEQLQKDLGRTKERLEQERGKLDQVQSDLQALLQSHQDLSLEIQELDRHYQKDQAAMFQQLDQLKNQEARRNSLENIQKNHSHFFAGVKAVLQRANQLGGIVGPVSEHISFAGDYQTAIEIALGGSSQHIIVEDEAAAKRAIDSLKKNRQGRATFLPLTTIKPRHLSEQNQINLSKAAGFLGMASHLVTFEPRLAAIFENLLGVTAIFDTVDHANQAARSLIYQVRMVTLDGTEIRPGGSFSGGANRHHSTTFIKPELERLEKDIAALKAKQVETEQKLARSKEELTAKTASLARIKEEGDKTRLLEQKLALSYEQISQRYSEMQELFQGLEETTDSQSQQALLDRKAGLESDLAAIAEDKKNLNQQIKQIKDDKDSIQAKVAELQQVLSDLRLEERDVLNTYQFALENKKRQQLELETLYQDMEQIRHQLTAQTEDLSENRLPDLKEQRQQAEESKATIETSLVQYRFELEDCQAQLEELEESLLTSSQKNEELIRQQAKLEADVENVSDKLRQFAVNLTEEYQMSLEEAQKQVETIDNEEAASQALRQLERQIKRLGPVNIDAIEQYDEVNERCQFLNSQKDDLVHAKDLLLSTIHEMDDEVKARFKTTFEAIRDSFRTTFVQMFGGGSADLLLTEGDLLTAGVEISVQPPGKKIQSLNLMSGGEKALSALALLFAIIRVKTIPFVILDEVEAALDEANVKRFGDYLNRFDKSSQFIVVTHRKGTMSAADSIYGVTMQESGVSKIVSVKLKDVADFDKTN